MNYSRTAIALFAFVLSVSSALAANEVFLVNTGAEFTAALLNTIVQDIGGTATGVGSPPAPSTPPA